MINCFMIFLSLLVSTIFGAGVLCLIRHKNNQKAAINLTINNFILSFALGTGLTSFLMFWAGLIGLSWSVFVIAIVILDMIFLYLMFTQKFHCQVRPDRLVRQNKWLKIFLILIILFQIIFVFSSAVLRPIINFDALANWAFKAKLFFYQPQITFTPSSDLFLGAVQQNYPLHVPLLMTWSYFFMGQVNDTLINLIFAFYYLGLIVFIYLNLRSLGRREPSNPSKPSSRSPKSRTSALIFTMFLVTLPLLTYHGFVAYADLILTFYFTLAVICLFNYFKNQNKIDLVCASLFIGICTWVKNEGLMLAGVLLIIFLIYLYKNKAVKTKIKIFLNFIFGILFFFLPWMIFKIYFGFGFSGLTSGGPIGFGKFHPEVFNSILRQIFVLDSFHLWPGIFILILIIYWRKVFKTPYFYLFLTILGVFVGYCLLYFFTPYYQYVLDGTIVGRNLLAVLPISVFLGGTIIKQ